MVLTNLEFMLWASINNEHWPAAACTNQSQLSYLLPISEHPKPLKFLLLVWWILETRGVSWRNCPRELFITLLSSLTTGCLPSVAIFSTIFQMLVIVYHQWPNSWCGLTDLSQLWSGRSSLSPSPGWWGNQQSSRRLVARCGSTPWWPMSCWARRCKTVSAWWQRDGDAKSGYWVKRRCQQTGLITAA